MRTEFRDGLLFCIVPRKAFHSLVSGAKLLGYCASGTAWRKGNSLLTSEPNYGEQCYAVCPNYFLLQEARQ